MAKLSMTPEGLVRIIGEQPSPEILEQLAGRIGPDEAAVVVSVEEMHAFLDLLRLDALDERLG